MENKSLNIEGLKSFLHQIQWQISQLEFSEDNNLLLFLILKVYQEEEFQQFISQQSIQFGGQNSFHKYLLELHQNDRLNNKLNHFFKQSLMQLFKQNCESLNQFFNPNQDQYVHQEIINFSKQDFNELSDIKENKLEKYQLLSKIFTNPEFNRLRIIKKVQDSKTNQNQNQAQAQIQNSNVNVNINNTVPEEIKENDMKIPNNVESQEKQIQDVQQQNQLGNNNNMRKQMQTQEFPQPSVNKYKNIHINKQHNNHSHNNHSGLPKTHMYSGSASQQGKLKSSQVVQLKVYKKVLEILEQKESPYTKIQSDQIKEDIFQILQQQSKFQIELQQMIDEYSFRLIIQLKQQQQQEQIPIKKNISKVNELIVLVAPLNDLYELADCHFFHKLKINQNIPCSNRLSLIINKWEELKLAFQMHSDND